MATSEPLASAVPTDPYADYATLLSASFTPSTHANALVLSTNDPSDKITDLTSPAQRVQYDLQEVNRRIDLLVEGNAEELIDRVNHIGVVGGKVEEVCISALSLETSFQRLEKKILEPYNSAKPLHTASANLHTTLVILRAATYYLHLSRRLTLQIAETHPQISSVDPHALLRAAVTISELSNPLSVHKLIADAILSEVPELSKLHITQSHVNNTLPQTIQRLQHQASKPPTLLMGQILYTISPHSFPAQIRNAVSASAGTALLVIQRALSSGSMVRGGQTRSGGIDEARVIWTGLERAFKEVQREGTGIAILERGLSRTGDEGESEGEAGTDLLELAKDGKEGLDGVAPSAWFWRECASGMDKRFRDACRSSPFLARTLKTGYSRLQGLVRDAVVGSREDTNEGYVGPEVVLMLQSIASVQQTR